MIGDFISIIDLILLVIATISVISGLFRGLSKQLMSFIGFFLVFIVSLLLCAPLGEFIYTVFGGGLTESAREFMLNKDALAGNEADKIFTVIKDWTNEGNVNSAITALGFPGIVSALVGDTFASFGDSAVLADVLPPVVAQWTLNGICFIILALVFGIVVSFIKKMLKELTEHPATNAIDKILGGVFALLSCYVVTSVIVCATLTFLPTVPFLSFAVDFINSQIELSASGSVPILNFIVNHNFIGQFVLSSILGNL